MEEKAYEKFNKKNLAVCQCCSCIGIAGIHKKQPPSSSGLASILRKSAESLGGVETLITYPTTQTHADVPEELRLKNGITPATLRLSVGIENADDLIYDLEQAFLS